MAKIEITIFILSLALLTACASAPSRSIDTGKGSRNSTIPFQFVGEHLIIVPVRINNSISTHFILDTGSGVSLVSKSICDQIGCKINGTFTGKRMSGQALNIPLSTVSSLALGSYQKENAQIGVLEMKGFLPKTPEFANIEGLLSLKFFEETPFSIDYLHGTVVIEDGASLQTRSADGISVPVELDNDQRTSLTVFAMANIPNGPPALMEVDTGSDTLILDEKFIPRLGVKTANLKKVEGKDETGHSYLRYFGEIPGPMALSKAPELEQKKFKIMFQKIIYDGLIGQSFLRNFIVTFDLPRSRLIFSKANDLVDHSKITNWGNNFASFWKKAKGVPFSKQLSLWDELVENPHEQFYSKVVWRNTNSPDFLERKTKRLKEVFTAYASQSEEVQANFDDFDTTLKSQIRKFRVVFPSAAFTIPIMAIPAPTFNGKTDSYDDHGRKHFLAFGVDTLTIRHDNPDVLYSHELFHVYHGEASGIKDDGASDDSTLIDSLWAEGLATYVSKELNPSATMNSVFMDSVLAETPEGKLPSLAESFLKVKDEMVHSKQHPEVYGQWFLLNKCPSSLTPCRSGYFLGYHVAKRLRQQYSLDEMAHWPFQNAEQKVVATLMKMASEGAK